MNFFTIFFRCRFLEISNVTSVNKIWVKICSTKNKLEMCEMFLMMSSQGQENDHEPFTPICICLSRFISDGEMKTSASLLPMFYIHCPPFTFIACGTFRYRLGLNSLPFGNVWREDNNPGFMNLADIKMSQSHRKIWRKKIQSMYNVHHWIFFFFKIP